MKNGAAGSPALNSVTVCSFVSAAILKRSNSFINSAALDSYMTINLQRMNLTFTTHVFSCVFAISVTAVSSLLSISSETTRESESQISLYKT